jgi:hypothetical protein
MQGQDITLVSKMVSLFIYHQQSLEYVKRKLSELPLDKTEVGHIGQHINDDLQKLELSSKVKTMAGGKGFEPLTLSLEG